MLSALQSAALPFAWTFVQPRSDSVEASRTSITCATMSSRAPSAKLIPETSLRKLDRDACVGKEGLGMDEWNWTAWPFPLF